MEKNEDKVAKTCGKISEIQENNLIQLENPLFIIKNHIPNITQTPQNPQNSGGFYGKTREVLLSSEMGQINDYGVEKVPINDYEIKKDTDSIKSLNNRLGNTNNPKNSYEGEKNNQCINDNKFSNIINNIDKNNKGFNNNKFDNGCLSDDCLIDYNSNNYINLSEEKNKMGSSGMEPNRLTPDYNHYNKPKYLNVSVSSEDSRAGMAEWSTQSINTRYPMGCVGSIPTLGAAENYKGISNKNNKIKIPSQSVLSLNNFQEVKIFENGI